MKKNLGMGFMNIKFGLIFYQLVVFVSHIVMSFII